MGLLQIIFGAAADEIDRKLGEITRLLRKQGEYMTTKFDNLEREMAEMGEQIERTIAEIRALKEATDDPTAQAKIEELATRLDGYASRLAGNDPPTEPRPA